MTPKYEARGEAPTITRRRNVLACARCRARRVKCDKGQPACSNCLKAGASCQPASQSAPALAPVPPREAKREPIDYSRLSRLEQEVARLSREVESNSPSREPSIPPSPVNAGDARIHDLRGQLVVGKDCVYFSPLSSVVIAEQVSMLATFLVRSADECFLPAC